MVVDTGPPGDYDDEFAWLIDSLPNHLSGEPDTGNEYAVTAIANQLEELNGDIAELDDSKSVQRARTKGQIDRLAKLVGVSERGTETLEHYRARTLARFQLNTSEGTVGDILGSLAEIFDTEMSDIWYGDWNSLYGLRKDVFFLPYTETKAHPLTDADIEDIAGRQSAAGKTVKAMYDGPLRPVSSAKFESVSDWSGYSPTPVELNDDDTIPDGPGPGGLLDL